MHFINLIALILILDWDERSETESSLYCESAKEVLSEIKVTETVTSETAKIINEKEIALNKISEHILITLCQLRNITGSRDVIK